MSSTEETIMNDTQVHEHVGIYLQQIDASIVMLLGGESTFIKPSIQSIAEHLLQAFSPDSLGLPLPDAIRPVELDLITEEHEEHDDDEDNHNDEINIINPPEVPTKRCRLDFLRQIFRAMPPIAMDVAAVVGDIVIDSTSRNISHRRHGMTVMFLFAAWLPIAPQLTPLVQDIFTLLQTNPLDYSTTNETKVSLQVLQFLIARAAHTLYEFLGKRGETSKWWSLGPLHKMVIRHDSNMENTLKNKWFFDVRDATRWHAARAIGFHMGFRPLEFRQYLANLDLDEELPVWILHPWIVEDDNARQQYQYIDGNMSLFDKNETYPLPTAVDIRRVIPLHSMLTHTGQGIVFFQHNPSSRIVIQDETLKKRLTLTPTTLRNLSLLGTALAVDPYPKPILICGPPGSGKSSLVREMIQQFTSDELLELHVDEETDSKTLVGSYTTTDIPGEFTWRPGALTRAVRSGKWVLMEDVDTVPTEIQAALVKLFEDRMLHLGGGKYERCHPNFRIFGTCTQPHDATRAKMHTLRMSTYGTGGKRVLHPNLWTKVHVNPLPFHELKEIAQSLHPSVPSMIVQSALNVFQSLDQSGREIGPSLAIDDKGDPLDTTLMPTLDAFRTGRNVSVRDFLKLLSRIAHTVTFERNITYATETQRTLCLAETVDIFAACCPDREQRREFISKIAAPHWGITAEFAHRYIESRQPLLTRGEVYTEIGRAKIPVSPKLIPTAYLDQKFASTNYALRLMESIAVGIAENEPILLVGETGCGKTSLIQQLARSSDRELIVQNLSLQTDSTDLLGGYRPLEIRQIARQVYMQFVDLFCSTFSRKQNSDFLDFSALVHKNSQWKKLSQCFQRASKLGVEKVKERKSLISSKKQQLMRRAWQEFTESVERFERQRLACDSGLAFAFTEGALVSAIRSGKWVLLDEMNLASSETLQRLCGLLDDSCGSVTLTERGDAEALVRHPEFRLFAAMNPATDCGKKDLPSSIRSRFTEIYVDELLDPLELRVVAAKYLSGVITTRDKPLEHTDTVVNLVEVYLKCRDLAEKTLADASGQRPRYTLRTLCRALSASKNLITQQRVGLARAIFEGFELAFEGPLDSKSVDALRKLFKVTLGQTIATNDFDHPGRRPGNEGEYVLIKPFWIKAGPLIPEDWSESSSSGRPKFILTKSMSSHLRKLVRACAAGPWPILLEGPTSAGKTTLVEYFAARCGHHVVRINNHEHTDIQEYTGAYAADSNGSLSFRDGILVQALRQGHWVILDELNLAPSEVLEALNRLLDDNRELFLPETNEVVKPHPNFRLFATQNPSGAYGGRKPLSRAFRNRFVEIHICDIPSAEMVMILERRSHCPPSHAKALVNIMATLRTRRSKSSVFMGKDGLITPRDLLRWAERHANSKLELAQEGYMLLGERLRSEEERSIVKEEIEANLKVTIDCDNLYYGQTGASRKVLTQVVESDPSGFASCSIAATKSMLRLLSLVLRCIQQREPILLVGDTGCGKTTVVQLLGSALNRKLHIVNCHATSETSDLIGGLRPVRSRGSIPHEMLTIFKKIINSYPHQDELAAVVMPGFLWQNQDETLPENAAKLMVNIASVLRKKLEGTVEESSKVSKRRKLENGNPQHSPEQEELIDLLNELETLYRRHAALFEWFDGPVVTAMRCGHLVLLDEMSLADDAVLERLNSVLEPTRTIVLAEKGDDGLDLAETSHIVKGHDDFIIFATMNPGGDFGKRELSPALRSRFTEIWVPAITDLEDIDLVLIGIFESKTLDRDSIELRKNILEYVFWFNSSLCGDPSSPFFDLVLSLRDVIAWARFVVEARKKMISVDVWVIFCHGACLMHLDGLGLGTGLSATEVDKARYRAFEFLLSQVPSASIIVCREMLFQEVHAGVSTEQEFGIHPFTIQLGPMQRLQSSFNFAAPTTSKNLLRVLRAMQISKPVLLEGSPGVGKTSLISALATASGHKLVRINLSEQTDISDLMGSDLPVPDEGDGSSSGATFKWCDGVLLRAIKNGDWVLLDELNLASQSVLEGLNSCLDHRAEVFIPELGKTFHCPPSFRIFAAQNPLAQGGGRKGLPKSFLNRFSKVYVDSLTQSDLNAIVASSFPSIPCDLARAMVSFNRSVHEHVVESGEFGDSGKPWEFNLRDVFRWCELLVAMELSGDFSGFVGSFARDLYLQRFRSEADRRALEVCFRQFFDTETMFQTAKDIAILQNGTSVIGMTTLLNCPAQQDHPGHISSIDDEPFLRALLNPMEALARCINMKWPCLLVGPSSSGKTTLLQAMATLADATLVNVCLTPSTDVNELVGGFEQIDTRNDLNTAISQLSLYYEVASKYSDGTDAQSAVLAEIAKLMTNLASAYLKMDITSASLKGVVEVASQLAHSFSTFSELSLPFRQTFDRSSDRMSKLVQRLKNSNGSLNGGGQFTWIDGVLVNAMTFGHWIHLENVNLCSSSVLDRLNPIMENAGDLLLNECSSGSDISGHRVVSAHSNFRIFLSMNSEMGEVSRAMRNRCVEIALLDPNARYEEDTEKILTTTGIDLFDVLSNKGISLVEVGSRLNKMYQSEYCQSRKVGVPVLVKKAFCSTANGFCSLQNRGLGVHFSDTLSRQICFEYPDGRECIRLSNSFFQTPSLQASTLRWGWTFQPNLSRNSFEGRLIRSSFANTQSESSTFLPDWLSLSSTCDIAQVSKMLSPISRLNSMFFVMALYQQKRIPGESPLLFLSSYHSSAANALEFLNFMVKRNSDHSTGHLSQLAVESATYQTLKMLESCDAISATLSPLETSFCLYEGTLDRSSVVCPMTPTLYPFFRALDCFMNEASLLNERCDVVEQIKAATTALLVRRDLFWNFVRSLRLRDDKVDSFLGFEEGGFIVQWIWFKKHYKTLVFLLNSINFSKPKQNLDILIGAIDRIVFGSSEDLQSISDSVWKYGGHPVIPSSSQPFDMILRLRKAGISCSLVEDNRFNGTTQGVNQEQIELGDLINSHHAILFATEDIKVAILGALCMIFFLSTDEAQDESRTGTVNVEDFQSLCDKVIQQKLDFTARWNATKIDFAIETLENSMDVEKLEQLRQQIISPNASVTSIHNSVLSNFAEIQANPFVEFWCVREESSIICCLASAVRLNNLVACNSLSFRIQSFVHVGLRCRFWPVGDLRPFQTLLWAIKASTSGNVSLDRIIKCLLPSMINNSSAHLWCNTFNRLDLISNKIELPIQWAVDEHEGNKPQLKSIGVQQSSIGPLRLSESVRTDTVFRLVGSEFSCSLLGSTMARFMTLENYLARQHQAKFLVSQMASLHWVNSDETSPISVVIYLLTNTLDALRLLFPQPSLDKLFRLLEDSQYLQLSDDLQIQELIGQCSHRGMHDLLCPVVFPLISHLRAIHQGNQPIENTAMAWIQIGLLRLHLLTPSSPLDPGKKPAAKVEQHNQQLSQLDEHLRLLRVDSGLTTGDFNPLTEQTRLILRSIDYISAKRDKQEMKRVERLSTAPAFYDFFRETRNFVKTVGSVESILSLTTAIRTARQSSKAFEIAMNREGNWQNTAGAFSQRLTNHFEAYEDIAVPVLVGIGCLKRGLRELLACYCSRPTAREVVQTFDTLVQFPVGDLQQHSFESSRQIVLSGSKLESAAEKASLAVSLASLTRFALQRRVHAFLDKTDLFNVHSLFLILCRSWLGNLESLETKDETDEEVLERTFREQFPNHSKEFNDMIISQDDGETTTEESQMQMEEEATSSIRIDDKHLSLLVNLHRELFRATPRKSSDASRIRSFHTAFAAAAVLHQNSRTMEYSSENMSSHVMALCLTSTFRTSSTNLQAINGNVPNFHRDPNPAETTKAALPLQNLLSRTSQLLTAFPGHSVLLSVGQVAEKVKKLEVTSTSVGKIMTGLEVILRKAQEWEQHASERVKLGSALQEVSILVAHWRKLELQSWSSLMDMREERFVNQAQRYWMRLYSVIHRKITDDFDLTLPPSLPLRSHMGRFSMDIAPWLWKGLKRRIPSTANRNAECNINIEEITKSIDTFMITATLGQFSERLSMLDAFANQLYTQPSVSDDESGKQLMVARMITAVQRYYGQFQSVLETKRQDLRHPIEKKLKDEVKLAKWDEQSYYALADAAERNHRKLMRFLREYDSVLDQPISTILEKYQCSGIRATDTLESEPTTKVPTFKVMFPSCEPEKLLDSDHGDTVVKALLVSSHKGVLSKYIQRLDHYQKKLQRVVSGQKDNSWARIGGIGASELSADIFDRIESLRREKTTKPMKARALVDLFKTLKGNGYKNTKWSVPEQQRHMAYLFHLPSLDSVYLDERDQIILASGNDYFQKSVAEINRLRSEVSLLGSQFLSYREIQLMLHLSEHGLLMICQQKSILSESLWCVDELAKKIEPLSGIQGSLPVCQLELSQFCRSFHERLSCAVENIEQLRLLLSTSISVVESGEKRAWVQDSISKVEMMVALLTPYISLKFSSIITQDKLNHIASANSNVDTVVADILILRESFKAKCVLPVDIFDACMEQLDLTVKAAQACNVKPSKEDQSAIEIETFLTSASSTIEKAMLAIQGVCKVKEADSESKEDDVEQSEEQKLWDCHNIACQQLDAFNIVGLSSSFDGVVLGLQKIHSSDHIAKEQRDEMLSIAGDVATFIGDVLEFAKSRVVDYVEFFRSTTKLQYILLRVFRTLVAKGYCSSETSDEDGDGGEGGDVSGMNFEDDVEGTGMGEGDGKNDVTDQLESEEQLLGLKNDEKTEAEEKKEESKKLDEEEAKQGMEMEADFEGELCDVPDDLKDDNKDDKDDEEELDREMGDGQDPNEEVVDEKMWGDSDDEDDVNQSDEKFEKDSGVKGETLDDEMRTKEDDEKAGKGEEEKDGQGEKDKEESKSGQDGDDEPQKDGDDKINEDLEDNYEDQHQGVEVREEEGEQQEEVEPMDLDDINLDGGDDAEDQEGGDPVGDPVVEELNGDEGGDDAEGTGDNNDAEEDVADEGENDEEVTDTGIFQSGADEDQENSMSEDEDQIEPDAPHVDKPHQQESAQESFGVRSSDGADNVKEQPSEENANDETNGKGDDNEPGDGDDDRLPQDPSGGSSGGNGQGGAEEQGDGKEGAEPLQAPNPFKNPGDATRFWHKKLKMIQSSDGEGDGEEQDDNTNEKDEDETKGEFEFTASDQKSTTQVLGETTEEEAMNVDEDEDEDNEPNDTEAAEEAADSKEVKPKEELQRHKQRLSKPTDTTKPKSDTHDDDDDEGEGEEEEVTDDSMMEQDKVEPEDEKIIDKDSEADNARVGNRVVSDLAQLQVREDDEIPDELHSEITTENNTTVVSQEDAIAARQTWSRIQGETHLLARRLCEKLRLVLEPLVATKLKGDYRTGKRINMKRVIGYIASGYRKDKIWLRRTKPAKRNYRVLLAVDNSESMMKSGAGEMALQAMATLALGMSQLEIGELGVASFGQDMRLLHPFQIPFTSESGSTIVQNFGFDESRTRTALCVESALHALESQGGLDSMQLIFMISDGRIERDSRSNLRRLMREMVEKNILLVMIIVEPGSQKKDSIVKMKEVTFDKGKPVVKQFMEDYPFPYYLVLEDMHQLPEVLGDALRQWFEMISQLQK